MQKSDDASASIILAGQALLVRTLITLEPHNAFGLKFEFFFFLLFFFLFFICFILFLIIFWGAALYILFKFCILVYFEHCPATDMQNGDEASPSIILAGQALLMKILITLELSIIYCSIFYTIVF